MATDLLGDLDLSVADHEHLAGLLTLTDDDVPVGEGLDFVVGQVFHGSWAPERREFLWGWGVACRP